MKRRFAIKSAILGIGAATSASSLFYDLTKDPNLKVLLNEAKAKNENQFWALVKSQFQFENGIKYFNHASLGSSPQSVIEATESYRRTLESFPSKYMWGGWDDQIEMVRLEAAKLLGAEPEEIALIHNTTEGMNIVAASIELNPGDEIIVGDHEHRTATSPWLYYQEKKGVIIRRPKLPINPSSSDELLEVYAEAITERTKVISMVHLTNTNGMILPVEEICSLARQKGIITVIDAAQSLGVIPCEVNKIGCDFFTASGHKWMFGPKGVGIFYAHKKVQHILKPFIANRSYDDPGLAKIEDYNTRNLPELLGLGAALDFHRMIGGETIFSRLKYLKQKFVDGIADNADLVIHTPLNEGLSHQLLVVEKLGLEVSEVKKQLIDDYGIDTRGMTSHGLNGVRISFSIYHDEGDIDFLIKALDEV